MSILGGFPTRYMEATSGGETSVGSPVTLQLRSQPSGRNCKFTTNLCRLDHLPGVLIVKNRQELRQLQRRRTCLPPVERSKQACNPCDRMNYLTILRKWSIFRSAGPHYAVFVRHVAGTFESPGRAGLFINTTQNLNENHLD